MQQVKKKISNSLDVMIKNTVSDYGQYTKEVFLLLKCRIARYNHSVVKGEVYIDVLNCIGNYNE